MQFPVLLVGHKNDKQPSMREVQPEEGATLAARHMIPFQEASAKSNENVEEIFANVVRLVALDAKHTPKKHKKCTIV